MLLIGVSMSVLASLLGAPALAQLIVIPTTLLLATMFYASSYFTYRDTLMPQAELARQAQKL